MIINGSLTVINVKIPLKYISPSDFHIDFLPWAIKVIREDSQDSWSKKQFSNSQILDR